MTATNFILVDPAAGAAQDAADSSITEVSGDIIVGSSKVVMDVATGDTGIAGDLAVVGDFAINTSKATIAAATGNTLLAGTLDVTGDVDVNSKLTVAATSGDTVTAGNITVGGYASITGALVFAPTSVAAATYTLALTDAYLHIGHTATAAVAVTLPTAQSTAGRTITLVDTGGNGGTNNITVLTEGAETINGEANLVINTDYGKAVLQSDGTDWFVIY